MGGRVSGWAGGCGGGGGGLQDYTVSFLGQVIVIVISRPRSLTIIFILTRVYKTESQFKVTINGQPYVSKRQTKIEKLD